MTIIMPVYIVNLELLELTKNALFSIDAGIKNSDKVIIVDNDSSVGSGYMKAIADTYIHNNTNLGYAKAVNQALKLTSSKHILIANNDIVLSSNWRDVALEVLKAPGTYSCHFKMVDYNEDFGLGNTTVYTGMERWCQGSCFVLKRYEDIYYDENYLNSYDDWDYFHTIRSKGYKTAYTNKASFKHEHSYTQKLINKREDNNKKNREYFKKKWGDYPEELFWKMYPGQMMKDWKTNFL